MSKTRSLFRAVTGGKGSNSAANSKHHIPFKITPQDTPAVKAGKAKAKASHMKVIAPKDARLPYSI